MNQKELVKQVAEQVGMSQTAAAVVIKTTFAKMSNELCAGGGIKITDFGSFKLKDKPARRGSNPATGKPIQIAAKRVVKFSPYNSLKDGVQK